MTRRMTLVSAPLLAVIAFASIALVAMAQPAPPGTPAAVGLANPRGLMVDGADVLVAEVGAGRITRIAPDGSTSVAASGLPTMVYFSEETGQDEVAGPSSVVPVEGGLVVTVAEGPQSVMQSVYFVPDGGAAIRLANLGEYETENNTDGGMTPGGDPDLLSNPYDVISYEGGLLVSDSGANALLHIDAEGAITPFAVFADLENPLFPDLGGPMRNQVPTGIAQGPDGAVYVATLTGFPFVQGGAAIYRLEDLNDDGDALDDGEVTVFASGLTSVTDVAFDTDGSLLAVEFSTSMLEQAPGRLIRIEDGTTEVLVEGLISPTGLVVTAAGRILVSQEFTGLVTDVTDGGTPPPAPTPTPTATPTPTPTAPVPAPADTGQQPVSASEGGTAAVILVLASTALLVATRRITRGERVS